GKRTFKDHGKVITVKNYIHPVEKLRAIAKQLYWEELRFTEREIDERVKRYYEDQNALAIFEKFKGTSVIYAIHLKKRGVIT
ncbi:MAG TPA: hypothetical protein VET23_08820, partial [Chitinophagaceae bacterium]|nr:hypothetical protein [Chitinophagaceae bacterium]